MEPTSVIGTKNKKGQVFTDPRIMMREAPRTPSFYTGSEVIKEAIRRASIDVMIAYPNTRPMCSANCDGAAAAVVVSGRVLKPLSLEQQRRAV